MVSVNDTGNTNSERITNSEERKNKIFEFAKMPSVDRDLNRTTRFLGFVGLISLLALITWAGARGSPGAFFSSTGLALFLLGGSALVGGVLGLLFGIPKSVSDPTSGGNALHPAATGLAPASPPSMTAQASDTSHAVQSPTSFGSTSITTNAGALSARAYAVNTNLEQISDWLTKIIVGVSLVELPSIRKQFGDLAIFFGDGFSVCSGNCVDKSAPVIAAVIIVYGISAGFLAGYLFTRMFLPGAFIRADNEALRQRNTELETKISEQRNAVRATLRMQGEIYNNLYRYNEGGFRVAITELNELLKSDGSNPALWVYLAAAHGQAHKWEREHMPESVDKSRVLKEHRDAALLAVKKALLISDTWEPTLQLLWDKNHPAKQDGTAKDENDLEEFYDDPDFRRLLSS